MQRRLSLRLATVALAVAASTVASAVEVKLDLRGPTPPLSCGEIVVRGAAAAEGEVVHPLRKVVTLTAAPEGAVVTCRGEGLWCPELPIRGTELTLPVFSAMTVTGKVDGPAAVKALTTGTVQGVVRSDDRRVEAIELRAALTLDAASFTFTAPRTELDLRFAFRGAAPVYRWGIAPPAPDAVPATVRLGTLTLHPGASLSGWARKREDELPLRGATVLASPATSDADQRSALHTWRGVTDERGFFQLHGLQPGTYRLEVSAEGRVPQVVEAVEVEPGSETLVGTVLLTAPLRVAVQVDPPRHPGGQPWTLVFSPVRRLPDEERVTVKVAEDGTAEVTSLRPAEYYVKVQSPSGEGPYGDSLYFEIREITTDGWLRLEVPMVEVAGTVRLGGEPIAADVALEGGDGDRVDLTSDEDGDFAGWMRRPDPLWLMATIAWREGEEERRRTVEVVPTVDDEGLELDIDLPAGTVFGEVVDAEGRSRPGFRVLATPADGASRNTQVRGETDARGRFHLTGLDPTRYHLQAGGLGGPTSEVVTVDLSSDLPVDGVRLVVWPTRKLTIAVTADGQPVPGASVTLAALGHIPVSLQYRTDAQGQIELRVPEEVERAVVTVFAPSQRLWSACLPVTGDRLSLALPSLPTGVLTMTLSGRSDLPPDFGGRGVLLTGDGGFIDYGALVNWSLRRNAGRRIERDGGRVVEIVPLPDLAPGSYAYTPTRAPEWEVAARACAGAFPDLDWVTLPPGGEVHLHRDSTEAQEERFEELTAAANR